MELTQPQFHKITELIYQLSGIKLTDKKMSLVSSRISKRLRSLNLMGVDQYVNLLEQQEGAAEYIYLIDAISTNFTHFYREPDHFDFLTQVLKKNPNKNYKIWCCASSSGEEPYSLAMTLKENTSALSQTKILATDISTTVLEKAKKGVYQEEKLKAIPGVYLNKYFQKLPRQNREVKDVLKSILHFYWLNLSNTPYPMNGPFDFIFCRNVMIYFDDHIRQGVIDEAHRLLAPGGYLMVGHSESLNRLSHSFQTVQPSIYRKAL